MVENAAIAQVVQIGVQSAAGSVAVANKRLSALGIEPDFAVDFQNFRPMGYLYPTVDAEGRESSTARLTGLGTYTEIVYPLSSLLTTPAISTPAGGTLSRLWTFEPVIYGSDAPKFFTVEHGDAATRVRKMLDAQVTDMNINIDRQRVELGGTMIGGLITLGSAFDRTNEVQTLTIAGGTPVSGNFKLVFNGATTANIVYNATVANVQAALDALPTIGAGNSLVAGTAMPGGSMTITFQGALAGMDVALITTAVGAPALSVGTATVVLTTPGVPTAIDLVPIIPSQINVYLDPTLGAIGTTKLLRAFRVNFTLGNRWAPFWPLDRTQTSYGGTVHQEPRGQMELTVQADSTGEALMTSLRAGTTQYIRVEALGAIIEGALPYTFIIDAAVKPNAKPTYANVDNVWCITYPMGLFADNNWGRVLSIRVQNALTAL